jgi:hypothetical protein
LEWFCKLSKEDPRVPASPYAVEFFNYTISEFHYQLNPLVSRMIDSNFADVSQQGAEIVTAYYLFYGFFRNELESCSVGTIPHRKGVAKTADALINDDRFTEQCRELLIPLFNDPDKEVREKTSFIFKDNFFDSPANISLALRFVQSKAFGENTFYIIDNLKDYKESLLPCHTIILEICNVITTTLLETSKDDQSQFYYDLEDIPPLLLRLYEQAQERMPDVANRCLDIWDELFEKRVGITRELTKSIEK